MPDYKQGKIYTVGCKTDDTLIYVVVQLNHYVKEWQNINRWAEGEGKGGV